MAITAPLIQKKAPKFFRRSLLLLVPLLLILFQTTFPTFRRSPPPDDHRQWPSDDQKITKALWDAGFKISSVFLEKNLHHIRACMSMQNKPITIFLPQDSAFRGFTRFRGHSLEYHVVTSKVVEEDFVSGRLSGGSKLSTCLLTSNLTVTDHPRFGNGYHAINGRRITHWNIYSDGHVIVHGIQNIFYSFLERMHM